MSLLKAFQISWHKVYIVDPWGTTIITCSCRYSIESQFFLITLQQDFLWCMRTSALIMVEVDTWMIQSNTKCSNWPSLFPSVFYHIVLYVMSKKNVYLESMIKSMTITTFTCYLNRQCLRRALFITKSLYSYSQCNVSPYGTCCQMELGMDWFW